MKSQNIKQQLVLHFYSKTFCFFYSMCTVFTQQYTGDSEHRDVKSYRMLVVNMILIAVNNAALISTRNLR